MAVGTSRTKFPKDQAGKDIKEPHLLFNLLTDDNQGILSCEQRAPKFQEIISIPLLGCYVKLNPLASIADSFM